MSLPPDESPQTAATTAERKGKIGCGTISVLVVFFGIITAMCIGSVLIVAILALR